jgi:hypothetical protein
MYVIKRAVNIAANHLSPVVPKLGDKLKIILGEDDKDKIGHLLNIGTHKDVQEGLVRLDHSGEVKSFQMRLLCKME